MLCVSVAIIRDQALMQGVYVWQVSVPIRQVQHAFSAFLEPLGKHN